MAKRIKLKTKEESGETLDQLIKDYIKGIIRPYLNNKWYPFKKTTLLPYIQNKIVVSYKGIDTFEIFVCAVLVQHYLNERYIKKNKVSLYDQFDYFMILNPVEE